MTNHYLEQLRQTGQLRNQTPIAFQIARRSFWRYWNAYHYHGVPGIVYGTSAFLQDAHIEQLAHLARRMAHEAGRGGIV